jgi:hypothetical protein
MLSVVISASALLVSIVAMAFSGLQYKLARRKQRGEDEYCRWLAQKVKELHSRNMESGRIPSTEGVYATQREKAFLVAEEHEYLWIDRAGSERHLRWLSKAEKTYALWFPIPGDSS